MKDSARKAMFAKRDDNSKKQGSELYRIYLKKFPESDIARSEKVGLGNRGGSFATALKNGNYSSAMIYADEFNILKLHRIGLQHHLDDEDMKIFKKKFNNSLQRNEYEP